MLGVTCRARFSRHVDCWKSNTCARPGATLLRNEPGQTCTVPFSNLAQQHWPNACLSRKSVLLDIRDSTQELYLPKPRIDYRKRNISYSGASLGNNAKNFVLWNPKASSREVLMNGSLNRAPLTRQICKPENRKSCMHVLYFFFYYLKVSGIPSGSDLIKTIFW